MSVTNELRHLALYLDELIDTGNGLEVGSSLYEQVQYNNSIIPRLYLMITGNGMNGPDFLTRSVVQIFWSGFFFPDFHWFGPFVKSPVRQTIRTIRTGLKIIKSGPAQ